MLNKILHTLGSRAVMALFNAAMLLITTRMMGAEIKGQISLLVLNLTIGSLIAGFTGGPALVYLTPRKPLVNLIFINHLWSLIVAIVFGTVLNLMANFDGFSSIEFISLVFFECVVGTHVLIILGQGNVKTHNVLMVLKTAITPIILSLLLANGVQDYSAFKIAYGLSLIVAFLVSSLVIWRGSNSEHQDHWKSTLRASLTYAGKTQLGAVAQMLNFRLSYYFLEILVSPPSVALIRIGIFSAAMQIAESLLHFSRSVSTVQFSTVANTNDRKSAAMTSVKLLKFNSMATFLGICLLILLPQDFYDFAFGKEFHEIKFHILILCPGIFALAFSTSIGHFYAGIGDQHRNTMVTWVGLAITLAIGYPLTLTFGTQGAALATSAVYCIQAFYQFVQFRSSEGISFDSFLPKREDLFELFTRLRVSFSRLQ